MYDMETHPPYYLTINQPFPLTKPFSKKEKSQSLKTYRDWDLFMLFSLFMLKS
jgi:hypothetical protein